MRQLDKQIKEKLDAYLGNIEEILQADSIAIISPILYGLDLRVKDAIEAIQTKKQTLVVIHDTQGGIVEVVERMVDCIRHFYKEVIFIIPDRAMSAGTIFALSGDRILMDYFSCLGPIDPQIEKDGKLFPALSYLNEFERLNKKAEEGKLTSAEYALVSKLDLGELYQFKQAKELSCELLIEWLTKYKFKNWKKTRTRQLEVTEQMKKDRAAEVADLLNKPERWHSHGRGIEMQTLIDEIKLEIEDYAKIDGLKIIVTEYFELLKDYMSRGNLSFFVHTKGYFQ